MNNEQYRSLMDVDLTESEGPVRVGIRKRKGTSYKGRGTRRRFKKHDSMTVSRRYILLFDGVCNLCSGMVKFIIRRDPHEKFRFSALQSEFGQAIIKKHNLNRQSLNTLILVEGKTLFVKSDAVLQILRELKGPWKFFYILKIIPKPVRDFIYDITAKSRYTIFGIRDSCMVPENDIRHRFL